MSKNNGGSPKASTDLSPIEVAMKTAKPPNIIHHRGDLNRVTSDGKEFVRQEHVFIPSIGKVKCTPYDNHFVYRDARKLGWVLFCTCGSPAVVVNYDAYKQHGSSQGALLVCKHHTDNNKHQPVNR
ncbi:hypothetical protein HN960_01580 [Candidatus Peregrinibacteria bacterium]|jgi:hypothetical protein|nr:hypothetical protein [Candidatus Peregrinibacteria bacterium]MBT7928379.1 hypothetical protein [Candidatus Peregrinibacteria bacterium]